MNYICNYVYWRSRGKRGPACEAAIKLGIIERKWIYELIEKWSELPTTCCYIGSHNFVGKFRT